MAASFRDAVARTLLVCMLSTAHSRTLEGEVQQRKLQYGGQARAAGGGYGGAAAAAGGYHRSAVKVQYVQTANVRYNKPETGFKVNTRYDTAAAAHYDRGSNTVYRESDRHSRYCKLYEEPKYEPTYITHVKKEYAKPKAYAKPAYHAEGYHPVKAGYRRLMRAAVRVLGDCPTPPTRHDYTLLWMFVALIAVSVAVWCCCRCFDSMCMWHPAEVEREKRRESNMSAEELKREEQLKQMAYEREHEFDRDTVGFIIDT